MATLTIEDFSCVDEAEIHLARLTVLIGPQASGKSVISKLIYFFYDILNRQFTDLDDEQTVDEFRASLTEEFKKWFPPSAWGPKKFVITFKAGPLFVKVTRAGAKKKVMDNDVIRIVFSPWFENQYEGILKSILERRRHRKGTKNAELGIDDVWRFRSAARKTMREQFGRDFVDWQLFVPAGRSFFTSIGKAIAAFEHSGMLDPLTVRFGRFFATIRDHRRGRVYPRQPPNEATQRNRNEMMRKLFGGNITFDRQQEYVESDDGRKIPFASLSSGQQELLPLWLSIEYAQESDSDAIVYIEEPEAHLFPTAQSQIIEFLASVISEFAPKMILTTHSPYVLTQINILLKAGLLAREYPHASEQIDSIVRKRNWLPPSSTVAYAIVGKRVKRITDEEGLLEGDYLDEVSDHLSHDYQRLIGIEIANEKK